MRLLLIDDNLEILTTLKEYCLATNLASIVTTASNGHEAINFCYQESFDCIVCDFEMPELNGIEVFELMSQLLIPMPKFIIFSGNVETAKSIVNKKNLCIHALVNKPHFDQLTIILNDIKSEKFSGC